MSDKIKNINALELGYNEWSHNGHKGGTDRNMSNWTENENLSFLEAIIGIGGVGPDIITPLPQIWKWFDELKKEEAYTRGKE